MKEEELDPGSVEFARRVGELLERSADELPARIRSRLTRARYAALERRGYRFATWRAWLPAGAAAAAVLAVLMLQGPRLGSELPQANSGGGEDFEMLADSGAFALAQDQLSQGGDVDYEFYDWAVNADQDERGGETGS
jgi:Protein of unknown function (DUF3619)